MKNQIISFIRSVLEERGVSCDFYIAGGSIFELLNHGKIGDYVDYDIFFYDRESIEMVEKAFPSHDSDITQTIFITENAISVSRYESEELPLFSPNNLEIKQFLPPRKIQFIKKHYGSPLEVMNKFDLSTSKICLTSDGNFVKADDYSADLIPCLENFKTNSLDRYFKYRYEKYAGDPGLESLKQIIRYLLLNYETILPASYISEPPRDGIDIIMHNAHRFWNVDHSQILHDEVCYIFNDKERLNIFERIFLAVDNIGLKNICDEFHVQRYLQKKTPAPSEVVLKYPEYFV